MSGENKQVIIKNEKEKILTIINSINSILYIFLGPFLVSYFLKINPNNISNLSYFYILSFILMIFFSLIIGKILEKTDVIKLFKFGIGLNFFYILYIIIMKEKILLNLNVLAFLYSSSCIFYNFPKNLFWSKIIDNDNRLKWTTQNKIIGAILSVFIPITLGYFISKYNYIFTGFFLLLLSLIEIILSNFIKIDNKLKYKFNLKKTYKKLNKNLKRILIVEYLLGMTIVSGALNVIVTILTIRNFKTDIKLGFINSLIAFISILFIYIYSKISNSKKDNEMIFISCFISLIFISIYILNPNYVTLILYNICYTIFFSFIAMIQEIRMLNNLKIKVDEKDKNSFLIFREIFLNFGKVISFVLLYIVSIINIEYLNILAFILTLTIFLAGFIIIKIDKNE